MTKSGGEASSRGRASSLQCWHESRARGLSGPPVWATTCREVQKDLDTASKVPQKGCSRLPQSADPQPKAFPECFDHLQVPLCCQVQDSMASGSPASGLWRSSLHELSQRPRLVLEVDVRPLCEGRSNQDGPVAKEYALGNTAGGSEESLTPTTFQLHRARLLPTLQGRRKTGLQLGPVAAPPSPGGHSPRDFSGDSLAWHRLSCPKEGPTGHG